MTRDRMVEWMEVIQELRVEDPAFLEKMRAELPRALELYKAGDAAGGKAVLRRLWEGEGGAA